MNEKIKELAEQAETKEIGYYFFDREKFAKLIIRECVDQCDDMPNSNDEWDKGVRWAANQIKAHFGVDK